MALAPGLAWPGLASPGLLGPGTGTGTKGGGTWKSAAGPGTGTSTKGGVLEYLRIIGINVFNGTNRAGSRRFQFRSFSPIKPRVFRISANA